MKLCFCIRAGASQSSISILFKNSLHCLVRKWLIFHSTASFPKDIKLQAYRCAHERCSGDLYALVWPVQTFPPRFHNVTSTESNQPHFLRILNLRSKYHSNSFFFSPRTATLYNRFAPRYFPEHFNIFKPRINFSILFIFITFNSFDLLSHAYHTPLYLEWLSRLVLHKI